MSKTEKQKMISGELYSAFEDELISERASARKLFTELNNPGKSTPEARAVLLKKLFGVCGKNVWIESPFFCDYGHLISVGDNVFINFNCTILDAAEVIIGNDVLLGPNVHIYSATHPTDSTVRAQGLEFAKPVCIEDNVWVGGSVVVCPGVTIGARTVIGAGSVVTKNLPPDVIAAGNPCRVVKPQG